MKYRKNTIEFYTGLTLPEMVISMSIMAVVIATVFVQFRAILNSWDSKAGAAEVIQNGRILTDHLNRNLSKAVRITAVSDSSETNGFIEFEDNDGNTLRYDLAVNNYIQFGTPRNLSDLAGPVSQLQFTCYDGNDFGTQITDVNCIRFVEVQTTLTNSATLGQDKTFTTHAYLRINGNISSGISTQTTYDYSNLIQGTSIFAYDGEDNQKKPNNSTTPSDVLSSGEYEDIEGNEGTFHSYTVLSNGRYAQMRFVIQIDEDKGDVTQIDASWNGKCVNAKTQQPDGASFYIWNYDSSGYELLEESADTEDEVTLINTLASPVTGYIGGVGEDSITLLIVSNGKRVSNKNCELFTDYVKLEIAATSGGSKILP